MSFQMVRRHTLFVRNQDGEKWLQIRTRYLNILLSIMLHLLYNHFFCFPNHFFPSFTMDVSPALQVGPGMLTQDHSIQELVNYAGLRFTKIVVVLDIIQKAPEKRHKLNWISTCLCEELVSVSFLRLLDYIS